MPQSVMEPMGRMIGRFALLEMALDDGVVMMIGADHQLATRTLIAGMNFLELLDRFRRLYHFRVDDPEKHAKLKALLPRIEQVNADRGELVHATWARGDSPDSATIFSAKARGKKPVFSSKVVTVAHIDGVGLRACEIALEIRDLSEEFAAHVRSLPDGAVEVTQPPWQNG